MIIKSLLDLDYYKLTMAQLACLHFSHVPVTYGYKNRTKKVRLAEIIDVAELRRQLDHAMTLRFSAAELAWIESQGIFCQGFVDFLRTLQLPGYELAVKDGQFEITVRGTWPQAIWWETLILSIVNELYYRVRQGQSGRSTAETELEGDRRLTRKLARLKGCLAKIIEFGTRRRFSAAWQEHVLRRIVAEAPEILVGTSNCRLAMLLGLKPIGTMAHETFMIFSGIFRDLDRDQLTSHNKVLQYWWDLYGAPLSIALTDTYGTDFFFRDFTREQASAWRGLRQDSGDPFDFGQKAIAFYQSHGIDPLTKLLVFSDGLDDELIDRLQSRFAGRINVTFGWGTNLTNDLGFETLSLVMKAIEACGWQLVKLSDTIQKAMGPEDEVQRMIRLSGYGGGQNRECVV